MVGDRIVGVMPTFVMPGTSGSLVNSLPFYGSHGGLVLDDAHAEVARGLLLQAFQQLCEDHDAITGTVVLNPLDESASAIREEFVHHFEDVRTGQLTPLGSCINAEDPEAAVMNLLHGKTRNALRKGLKCEFEARKDHQEDAMASLHELHQANMESIGGQAKPLAFFELVESTFQYGQDYEVYRAERNGKVAAAMLVFYFNQTVEYFTPAIREEDRSDQPLSVLILQAMIDAAERRMQWWNWGGTWASQEGVHRFKSRWGAVDREYHYLIHSRVSRDELLAMHEAGTFAEYPYFYAFPYSILTESGDG